MTPENAVFRRIMAAAGIDNFATGVVGGAYAVVLARTGGLGALGAVLFVRVVATVLFSWWSHRVSRHSGTLPERTLRASVLGVTVSSVIALTAVCAGAALPVLMAGYLVCTTANAMTALQISSRAPREAARLAPANALCLAAGAAGAAGIYAVGGAGLLAVLGSVACLAQLGEYKLLRSANVVPCRVGAHKLDGTLLGIFVRAAGVAFISYAPLAMTGGIVAVRFGTEWVAPVLLIVAASSFGARWVQTSLHGHKTWVGATVMAVCNLGVMLSGAGVGAYLAGRVLVGVLSYGVDGSLREAAWERAGVRGLAATSSGLTVGMSLSLPLFGAVADRVGLVWCGGIYAVVGVTSTALCAAGVHLGARIWGSRGRVRVVSPA